IPVANNARGRNFGTADAGRCAEPSRQGRFPGADTSFCHQPIEGGFRSRISFVRAIHRRRHGYRQHSAGNGNADAVADCDLPAIQAAALRSRGWLVLNRPWPGFELRVRMLQMSPEAITRILREGLVLVLLLSAGPMLASMLIGLVVAILQATTQIQEQTLSYVPKLAGVFVTIGVLGPWILTQAVKFTIVLLDSIATVR